MAHSGPRRPRIVVVGSYAAGLVMRTERIPAPGETVLGRDFQIMDGGKGSNQAVACARLGAEVLLVAAVGDDAHGDRALALFARERVDVSHVRRVSGVPTGAGFIIVDDQGSNAIAVDLGANRALSPDDIDQAEEAITAADAVLAQLEIPLDTALYAMSVARRHGVRTILNPAPALPFPAGNLARVDILTPNLTEAQVLSGQRSADAVALSQSLREAGAGVVVLTMGEHGAYVLDDQESRMVPAYRVEPVDTTGAGDAFNAALAVALSEGAGLHEAVAFACAAGAYSTRSLGTIPSYPSRRQLRRFVEQAPPSATSGESQ